MASWPVFLTAPKSIESKILNKTLLLQDFEFTNLEPGADPFNDNRWVLITSSSLSNITDSRSESPKSVDVFPTPPFKEPISSNANDFAGATLDDINSFMRAEETQSKLKTLNVLTSNWVVIDQKGIEGSTYLMVHRPYRLPEEESSEFQFQATRIPNTEAWIMMANLELVNMDFEDFVDEDQDRVVREGDGLYYESVLPFTREGMNEAQLQSVREVETRREEAVRKMREHGYVD